MKCQLCKANVATIHLTEIESNKKKEVHLCEDCYKTKHDVASPAPTIDSMIKTFLKNAEEGQAAAGVPCPVCGATLAEFNKKGLFGCPGDYRAFGEAIQSLIEKIHGAWKHTGKAPRRLLASKSGAERLITLRNELNSVIRNEMYEKAAALRDEIRQLEQENN